MRPDFPVRFSACVVGGADGCRMSHRAHRADQRRPSSFRPGFPPDVRQQAPSTTFGSPEVVAGTVTQATLLPEVTLATPLRTTLTVTPGMAMSAAAFFRYAAGLPPLVAASCTAS